MCRVVFDADKHGWSAEAFHSRVDRRGPGVVVATTEGGAVCGGYNPDGWYGNGDERLNIATFLFTWPDGDTSAPPIMLKKVGGPGMSVIDTLDGPKFGVDGLHILLQEGRERIAQSRLGTFYENLPGGGRSLFAPSDDWKAATLTELKVIASARR